MIYLITLLAQSYANRNSPDLSSEAQDNDLWKQKAAIIADLAIAIFILAIAICALLAHGGTNLGPFNFLGQLSAPYMFTLLGCGGLLLVSNLFIHFCMPNCKSKTQPSPDEDCIDWLHNDEETYKEDEAHKNEHLRSQKEQIFLEQHKQARLRELKQCIHSAIYYKTEQDSYDLTKMQLSKLSQGQTQRLKAAKVSIEEVASLLQTLIELVQNTTGTVVSEEVQKQIRMQELLVKSYIIEIQQTLKPLEFNNLFDGYAFDTHAVESKSDDADDDCSDALHDSDEEVHSEIQG